MVSDVSPDGVANPGLVAMFMALDALLTGVLTMNKGIECVCELDDASGVSP